MAVGEGHMLYIEECAAVDGLPVVFLHGGPGSGCSPNQRRLFDPARGAAVVRRITERMRASSSRSSTGLAT